MQERDVITEYFVISREDEAFRGWNVTVVARRTFASLCHGGAQSQATEEDGARSWEDAAARGGGSVDPLMHCPSACLCRVWLPL